MIKKINKSINKIHLPKWVVFVLAASLILRIPSFFEPFHYGDELIYLSLGDAVRKGLVLYRDIHDNKPPLLYLTAAIAGNIFWFKALLAAWSLATIVLFWKLIKLLVPGKTKLVKAAVWAFTLLSTLPLLEGNIANAENFMIGFSIAAFLILLGKPKNSSVKKQYLRVFIAGLLFSVSALFKIPAAFDVPVIVFYWIVTTKKFNFKTIFNVATKTIVLGVGFLLPILATMAWYFSKGAFSQYLIAAFSQNVGYLSSFRPGDVVEPFFIRNGPLLIRAGLTGVASLVIFIFRNKLSKPFIFASLWLFLSLFAITLSERPYPHYILQGVPAMSILISILIAATSIEQSLAILPLLLAILAPVYYKFWYYPTFSYYSRFIEFASGSLNREQYFDAFNGNVNRNYQVAQFLADHTAPKDKVFVWGDSSAIYAIARRLPPIKYVADYHIGDFSSPQETISRLENDLPVYIVVLPKSPAFKQLTQLLNNNYLQISTIEGADIWRKMAPETIDAINDNN